MPETTPETTATPSSVMIGFFIEFYNRMRLESPRFFQIIQSIGVWASIITGIPVAIEELEAFLEIEIPFPEIVDLWILKIVFACGVLTKFLAKLPNKPVPTFKGEIVPESELKAKLPITEKSKDKNGSIRKKAKLRKVENQDDQSSSAIDDDQQG